jgi:hypothetical protein
MNITPNENSTITAFNEYIRPQLSLWKSFCSSINSSRQQNTRLSNQRKISTDLSLQIIEICSLCFILVEHTIIFILTFRKKSTKNTIFHTK